MQVCGVIKERDGGLAVFEFDLIQGLLEALLNVVKAADLAATSTKARTDNPGMRKMVNYQIQLQLINLFQYLMIMIKLKDCLMISNRMVMTRTTVVVVIADMLDHRHRPTEEREAVVIQPRKLHPLHVLKYLPRGSQNFGFILDCCSSKLFSPLPEIGNLYLPASFALYFSARLFGGSEASNQQWLRILTNLDRPIS